MVILLDSITRLARAYNTIQPHSGKILSGGVDANALHKPKRFFGAAQKTSRKAAPLSIIATALVDTGSRMDEVILKNSRARATPWKCISTARWLTAGFFLRSTLNVPARAKEELLYHPDELQPDRPAAPRAYRRRAR